MSRLREAVEALRGCPQDRDEELDLVHRADVLALLAAEPEMSTSSILVVPPTGSPQLPPDDALQPALPAQTPAPPTALNMLREVEVFLRELDGNQSGTIRDLADKCAATLAVEARRSADLEVLIKQWRNDQSGGFASVEERDGYRSALHACAEELENALLSQTPPIDARLQVIAGLVNTYHNEGSTLTATETLRCIADALGKPMAQTPEPPTPHGSETAWDLWQWRHGDY